MNAGRTGFAPSSGEIHQLEALFPHALRARLVELGPRFDALRYEGGEAFLYLNVHEGRTQSWDIVRERLDGTIVWEIQEHHRVKKGDASRYDPTDAGIRILRRYIPDELRRDAIEFSARVGEGRIKIRLASPLEPELPSAA